MGRITILSLSWRDIKSPKSGGAEVHTFEMLRRADKRRYRIIQFSPLYEGLEREEVIDGITFHREGNAYSVIYKAWRYYRGHRNEIDIVIDQCNTHRFFTKFWIPPQKRIFYIHQLTREIWRINSPGIIGWIGEKLETPMLRLQRNDTVITVSESTKKDLTAVGFDESKIYIIPNALGETILEEPFHEDEIKGNEFIYVGRYSKYKGINVAIIALGLVKRRHPDVRLRIVGKKDEEVIQDVIEPLVRQYGLTYGGDDSDIELCGFVPSEEKYRLMRKSRALLFPSQREGWGIIVSEAGAMGTPSIVYDSPGCRDAVDYGCAGYLCQENSPKEVARLMILSIEDKNGYRKMRMSAYDFAQGLSWEKNKGMFDTVLDRMMRNNTYG